MGTCSTNNGSRTEKPASNLPSLERIHATRITVTAPISGRIHSNMHPEYLLPTSAPEDRPILAVGYFFRSTVTCAKCAHTFLLDTVIPPPENSFLHIVPVHVAPRKPQYAEPSWAWPISHLDENLVSHPFTAESAADGLLSALVRDSDPTLWRYVTTPFSMNVNLKITKKLYRDKMAVALFVNKLLDYTPDYHTSDGRHIRREVTPYFGMELNIKL